MAYSRRWRERVSAHRRRMAALLRSVIRFCSCGNVGISRAALRAQTCAVRRLSPVIDPHGRSGGLWRALWRCWCPCSARSCRWWCAGLPWPAHAGCGTRIGAGASAAHTRSLPERGTAVDAGARHAPAGALLELACAVLRVLPQAADGLAPAHAGMPVAGVVVGHRSPSLVARSAMNMRSSSAGVRVPSASW